MATHARSIYTPAPTIESLQARIAELTKQNENLAAVIRGLRANPNAVAIRVVNPAAPAPRPAPRPAPKVSPLSGQIIRPALAQPEQTSGPRMSGMAVLRALAPAAPVARPPVERNAEAVAMARTFLRDGYTYKDSAGRSQHYRGGFEPNADAIEALTMFEDPSRFRVSAKVGIADAAAQIATLVRRFATGRRYLPKP